MNRVAVCLVVAAVAAPWLAASAPKPTRLSMKRTEGTNLHIERLGEHEPGIWWLGS